MKTKKQKTKPRASAALVRNRGSVRAIAQVTGEIQDLIEAARNHVSVTANLALVTLYWNIGQVITRDIQRNERRAEYGMEMMEQLASVLTQDYGHGYSVHNLRDMRRFFDAFVIRQTMSAESSERIPIDFNRHQRLGWSHYRVLLSQSDPLCRKFYLEQATEQRWTVRELRRQIERGLFERVALSKDTPRLAAQEKRTGSREIARYEDIFKDPYVLDFLGLKGAYSEKDLEAAIVHNLELLLQDGAHRMKVAEYLTHLPDKHLLKERLKVYSKLLKEREL